MLKISYIAVRGAQYATLFPYLAFTTRRYDSAGSSQWQQLFDTYLHGQRLPPCPKLLWSAIAILIERSSSSRMLLFRSESSTLLCTVRTSICLFSNLSSSGHSIFTSHRWVHKSAHQESLPDG